MSQNDGTEGVKRKDPLQTRAKHRKAEISIATRSVKVRNSLMTFVDKGTHKKLKLLSIEKEKHMEDLFQEAVELLLEMHNM